MRIRGQRLPLEYVELEYVQGTGTQWVDSGFVDGPSARVVIDMQFTTVTPRQQRLFGHGYDSDTGSNISFDAYINGSGYFSRAACDGAGNWQSTSYIADTKRHVFDLNLVTNKYTIYTDGRITLSNANAKTITRTNTATVGIFRRSNTSTASNHYARAKLFSCRMWNGDSLERNFVPCERRSDGKAGLYDLVNSVFYVSDGTSDFVAGPELGTCKAPLFAKLPDAYQEVDYLQSDGNQRIAVGNSDIKKVYVKHSFSVIGSGRVTLQGGEDTWWGTDTGGHYLQYADGAVITTSQRLYEDTIYEMTSSQKGLKFDGVFYKYNNSKTYNSYALFQINNYPIYKFAGKVYSAKTYDSDDVLINDFVPCYRKSDSKPGLYDLVKQTFLTNQGTGEFTVGNDVVDIPSEYQRIEYLEAGTGQYIETALNFNHESTMEIYGKSYTSSAGNRACIASEYGNGSQLSLEITTGLRLFNSSNQDFVNEGYVNDKVNEYVMRFDRTAKTMSTTCGSVERMASNALYGNNGVNFFMFVDRKKRFSTFNKTHRLYYFRIVKDGTLYCDLVPCRRKSDEALGLFDKVSGSFYMNKGTGAFVAGRDMTASPVMPCTPKIVRLPSEYQEVTFLESTGGQYIDTGVALAGTESSVRTFLRVEITVAQNGDRCLIGNCYGANKIYWLPQYRPEVPAFRMFSRGNGANNIITGPGFTTGKVYNIMCYSSPSLQTMVVDGSIFKKTVSLYVMEATQNLYMFASNEQGTSAENFSRARIYGARIFVNDSLRRDFVPCYRKSDNVAGMYDLVTGAFFTNSGTGSFVIGTNVTRVF